MAEELAKIIPYQELLGNYDKKAQHVNGYSIIPYQELLGNYDIAAGTFDDLYNYTIPRAIREL